MKITKLETFTSEFVGFVRVTTEDGRQGWGQLSTYNSDITASIFHRQIAPWALGYSVEDLETLVDEIPLREHKYLGSYLLRALSGLDTAILDWCAKDQGVPVTTLFGGSAGPLRSYASSMRRDITPEEEAKRFVGLRDEFGFDAFKFRVGAECGRDIDEWEGRTEAVIPAIRQALGDEISLLVDGNSGFSAKRAIEVGRILEDNGIEHFEEPCPYWHLEETKAVTDALSLNVTGGEQDCDLEQWKRIIAMRAVDILQPDILYMGGMVRTMDVVRMGAEANFKITPHCANLSMVTLFTMHLLRAIPNAGHYLEFSIEGADYYPWQQDLFVKSPYGIVDGQAFVTEEPGWGVEINPEWLAKSRYQVSEVA